MFVQVVSTPTAVGDERVKRVWSPIWPSLLLPQHQSVADPRMPQVWEPPAEIAVQLAALPIWRGVAVLSSTAGSPMAPLELSPQHHSVPDPRIAHVCA